MKITELRSIVVGNPWKNWVFVALETDDGIVGVGEATAGLETGPVVAAIDEIRHLVIGRDPRDVRAIWQELYLAGFLRVSRAMAGIEAACWDIIGKHMGAPVWRLLGGKVRGKVRVYANGWYSGSRSPDAYARRAAEVVARGYTALKFDPFGDAYRVMRRDEARAALNLVAAVREAVGPDVDILIEAHDRFSVDTAVEIGRGLAEYEVTWLETPVLSTDLPALAEAARRIPVRVIAGERANTMHDIAALAEARIGDIMNPELLNLGGILPMLNAAAIADAHHTLIAPHNAESPLKTMISLQVSAVVSNLFIQECFDDFLEPWTSDVIKGFERVDNGYLAIPDAPGLGVSLDEREARRHPYGERHFLRMFRPGWEARQAAAE